MKNLSLRIGLPIALFVVGACLGFWGGQRATPAPRAATAAGQAGAPVVAGGRVLYWYDPMAPNQHFDKPGKSPFMDMPLVARYADAGAGATDVAIDPDVSQNLGVRLAKVRRGSLESTVSAPGSVQFNDRDVAVVQARAAGFVQRVYAHAPGDFITRDAPLADVLVPDWIGAQEEFLAVARSGDAALAAAVRRRLLLLGMPESLIEHVADSGTTQADFTIASPIAGVITELGVRAGMTLSQGAIVAKVNGIGTVWLEAGIPEAQAGSIRAGQAARVLLSSFPGQEIAGRVIAVLPQVDAGNRSLRVRLELPNPAGRLKPGMFAQVQLATGTRTPVLLLPTEAVIRTGARNLVMAWTGEGRYRPVEVTLGQESGGSTAVLAGLAEGDRVVASGQFLLDSEAAMQRVPTQGRKGGALQDRTQAP